MLLVALYIKCWFWNTSYNRLHCRQKNCSLINTHIDLAFYEACTWLCLHTIEDVFEQCLVITTCTFWSVYRDAIPVAQAHKHMLCRLKFCVKAIGFYEFTNKVGLCLVHVCSRSIIHISNSIYCKVKRCFYIVLQ